MYGGFFNPLSFTLAVLLFVYGLVTMPLGVSVLVILKFIPVYLYSLVESWKLLNVCKAVQLWGKTLVKWIKEATCKNYCEPLTGYAKLIKMFKFKDDECVLYLCL